ncbi:MAG TPA: hypothetical protein VNA14_02195 [Mycobacteriales bacterium]|nr:hypothetical protein [Mycobacteriales bacterium]
MRRRRTRLSALAAAALVSPALLGACSNGGDGKPVVAVTLPAGSLADQVLQEEDVPDGFVPLLAQTGPADVVRIAGFSSDSTAAEKSLREHGFKQGYVVQYGDQKTGRFIVNVVATFDTEAGATADLTADITSAQKGGTPFPVTGLGDQAAGVRGAKGAAAQTASDLVTVRWRKGSTTWLLAVGASGTVEQDAVVSLAKIVLKSAAGNAEG